MKLLHVLNLTFLNHFHLRVMHGYLYFPQIIQLCAFKSLGEADECSAMVCEVLSSYWQSLCKV